MAVNMVKDMCNNILPKTLYEDGLEINQDKVVGVFVSFFERKVRNIIA
jgi:hypothetical protein